MHVFIIIEDMQTNNAQTIDDVKILLSKARNPTFRQLVLTLDFMLKIFYCLLLKIFLLQYFDVFFIVFSFVSAEKTFAR